MTIDDAVATFSGTTADDWRELPHGAVAHRDAAISDDAEVCGPAVFRGGWFRGGWFYGGTFHDGWFYDGTFRGGWFYDGTFRGGTFHDGTFDGGTFYGGTFHDGWFYGGTFDGGTFHDGTFRGGTFRGGTFHDGTFRGGWFHGGTFDGGTFDGGTFRGGTFHDGTFRGGWFYGGTFDGAPLLVASLVPWCVTVGRPGCVAIGCECHSVDDWRASLDAIAKRHGVAAETVATIRDVVLPLFERWLRENPGVVTAAEAAGGSNE